MKLTRLVNDIFDNASRPIEFVKQGKNFTTSFQVGNETFIAEFVPSLTRLNSYKVSFSVSNTPKKLQPNPSDFQDPEKYSDARQDFLYGVTNSHNAINVLKMMINIMVEFIKTHQPDGLIYKDFDEGARMKVYAHMGEKVADKVGFKALAKNNHVFIMRPGPAYDSLVQDLNDVE